MKSLRMQIVLMVSLTAAAPLAMGQVKASVAEFSPNAWMRTPTKLSEADSVAAPLRVLRDQYFDKIIGYRVALNPENAAAPSFSEGSFLGEPAEILELPNRAVLIGTFTGSKSVLSTSGRAIYTEVTIRVAEKFEDASGTAHQGAEITIALPGGTVTTPDARTISYLTQPRRFFIQPASTYLFVLEYHASGDFYMLGNDWDLSDGVVRANSSLGEKRQREGPSSLIGLTRSQLVQTLNKRFSVDQ